MKYLQQLVILISLFLCFAHAQEGQLKRIAFCLDHGADVNSSDAGYPPLTAICLFSRNQLIKELEDDATEEEHQEVTRKQQELDKKHIECSSLYPSLRFGYSFGSSATWCVG